MGFTPLEGLAMGTRSGDLDPSLVLFLQRHAGLDVDAVEHVLERESGLRGMSGRSSDYQVLEQCAADGDDRAALALAVFAYRVRKYLGAYWAALGGVDLLVFSGGIGENSAFARASILEPMHHLGWRFDAAANSSGPPERRISPDGAQPAVWILPTRETAMIARHVRRLVSEPGITAAPSGAG
jgi:acetate kinase